jgi:predicted permease
MGLNQIVLLAQHVKDKVGDNRVERFLSDYGITIVSLVGILCLLCIIISSFRLIRKYDEKLEGMVGATVASPNVNTVPAQVSQVESRELVSDLELVAVITAAIYAYEEACGNTVSENSLYVRSIKKVNTNWRNA